MASRRESNQPLWYTLTAIVVSCIIITLVLGTTSVLYTQSQISRSEHREDLLRRDSDQRWCSLLVQLDGVLSPSATIKPTIASLREQFGCNVPNPPSASYVTPTPRRS